MTAIVDALINFLERHLINDLLRCLRQASQKHLLKMSSRIFFKFPEKIRFPLIYFFLSFLPKCWVLFCHKVVTTFSFWRHCSDQKLTLLQRCIFDFCFPAMYQGCSNGVLLKSFSNLKCNGAPIIIIFIVCVNVKYLLNFAYRIWSSLPKRKKGIFDLVLFTDEKRLHVFCWEIQQGRVLILFSVAGMKTQGYQIYMLQWYLKT